MEFLGVAAEISEELLWVLSLNIVLFLFVNDVFEFIVTNWALSASIFSIDTLVMESMTAHEVNGW